MKFIFSYKQIVPTEYFYSCFSKTIHFSNWRYIENNLLRRSILIVDIMKDITSSSVGALCFIKETQVK